MAGHLRVWAGLLMLAAGSVQAQEQKKPSLSDMRLDLSVPSVPAFTALDVQPSTVAKPGTVRELAVALSSGVTATGQLQSGLAIEASPVKLAKAAMGAKEVTGLAAFLTPLQVSLATNSVAVEEGTSNQVALGGRYTVGRYDPMKDKVGLGTCLVGFLNPLQLEPGADVPERTKPVEEPIKGLESCRNMFRAANLATSGLEVSGAYSWSALNEFKVGDLRPLKTTMWASYSFAYNSFQAPSGDEAAYRDFVQKLSDSGSDEAKAIAGAWGGDLTLFGRYDRNHSRGVAPANEDFTGALRLSYKTDGTGVFLEGGIRMKDLGGVTADGSKTEVPVGIGGDIRLSNGTWLGVFFGGDASTGQIFALGNLQWAIGEKPFFD